MVRLDVLSIDFVERLNLFPKLIDVSTRIKLIDTACNSLAVNWGTSDTRKASLILSPELNRFVSKCPTSAGRNFGRCGIEPGLGSRKREAGILDPSIVIKRNSEYNIYIETCILERPLVGSLAQKERGSAKC